MASELSIDQRLTLIRHVLNSVVYPTPDGGYITVMERLEMLDIPIDELLGDTWPFSSPPYTSSQFEVMLATMRRE